MREILLHKKLYSSIGNSRGVLVSTHQSLRRTKSSCQQWWAPRPAANDSHWVACVSGHNNTIICLLPRSTRLAMTFPMRTCEPGDGHATKGRIADGMQRCFRYRVCHEFVCASRVNVADSSCGFCWLTVRTGDRLSCVDCVRAFCGKAKHFRRHPIRSIHGKHVAQQHRCGGSARANVSPDQLTTQLLLYNQDRALRVLSAGTGAARHVQPNLSSCCMSYKHPTNLLGE